MVFKFYDRYGKELRCSNTEAIAIFITVSLGENSASEYPQHVVVLFVHI